MVTALSNYLKLEPTDFILVFIPRYIPGKDLQWTIEVLKWLYYVFLMVFTLFILCKFRGMYVY